MTLSSTLSWVTARLFGGAAADEISVSEETPPADTLRNVAQSITDIDKGLAQAECALTELDRQEAELQEETEQILMQCHDLSGRDCKPLPDSVVSGIRRQCSVIQEDVRRKREDLELRVLTLNIRRTELEQERREASNLIEDVGFPMPLEQVLCADTPASSSAEKIKI
eukprot:Hpha_TRINITY_DN35448_c0_g1::TRINITY_DN35448_c0_g1_i1::g.83389::m.83389